MARDINLPVRSKMGDGSIFLGRWPDGSISKTTWAHRGPMRLPANGRVPIEGWKAWLYGLSHDGELHICDFEISLGPDDNLLEPAGETLARVAAGFKQYIESLPCAACGKRPDVFDRVSLGNENLKTNWKPSHPMPGGGHVN